MVGHNEVETISSLTALQKVRKPERCFSRPRFGRDVGPRRGINKVISMRKINVHVIHDVLGTLKIVARYHFDRRADGPFFRGTFFQAGQWPEFWRLTFSKVSEYQAVGFVDGIGSKFTDFSAERFRLRRLLSSVARLV